MVVSDKIQDKIDNIYKFFDDKMRELSNYIEKDSDFRKMENNDRDGYLYTTQKEVKFYLII